MLLSLLYLDETREINNHTILGKIKRMSATPEPKIFRVG